MKEGDEACTRVAQKEGQSGSAGVELHIDAVLNVALGLVKDAFNTKILSVDEFFLFFELSVESLETVVFLLNCGEDCFELLRNPVDEFFILLIIRVRKCR